MVAEAEVSVVAVVALVDVELPEDARLCIRLCRSVSMFLLPPVALPETDAVADEFVVASLLLPELWECNAAIRL